jgi:hypothetical protein
MFVDASKRIPADDLIGIADGVFLAVINHRFCCCTISGRPARALFCMDLLPQCNRRYLCQNFLHAI